MPAIEDRPSRLALLIDADNTPPKFFARLLDGAGELGTVVVRRAYGNYTTWSKAAVRKLAQEHAVAPVLVLPATTGKDAADLKLALDAIDLLHRGNLDAMCIASSDGDFLPLVMHIRENGLSVYGFGESKAPEPYRLAFDRFIALGAEPAERPVRRTSERRSRTAKAPAEAREPAPPPQPQKPEKPAQPDKPPIPEAEILQALEESTRDGWAALSAVGHRLGRSIPGFAPKIYGYRNLRELITALDGIETSETRTPAGNSLIRVRRSS